MIELENWRWKQEIFWRQNPQGGAELTEVERMQKFCSTKTMEQDIGRGSWMVERRSGFVFTY